MSFPMVDVGLAARVSARLASAASLDRSYLLEGLQESLGALVAEAEPLVKEETGFEVPRPARARVMGREEWAAANIGSMLELLSGMLDRIESRLGGPGGGLAKAAYRPALGVQMGAVLGFLSHRVLGQYDLFVADEDEIWFVGPNIVTMERRFGFVPRDFRLWLALHELTHRSQFTAHPWVRGHFIGLVHTFFESVQLDPKSVVDRVLGALRNPGDDLPAALLGPEQRRHFDRLQAFMTVIEGHGTFVMDRIAEDLIPTQPRMRRVLEARAALSGPIGRIMRKLLGLDLKRRQYVEGRSFFDTVFGAGGPKLVGLCFESSERLPTLEEIASPARWLSRVRG